MYAQDNNPLPVWIILSPAYHHISINSHPFLVGIVSLIHEYGMVKIEFIKSEENDADSFTEIYWEIYLKSTKKLVWKPEEVDVEVHQEGC